MDEQPSGTDVILDYLRAASRAPTPDDHPQFMLTQPYIDQLAAEGFSPAWIASWTVNLSQIDA
jgi:hypothetical protein